MRTLALIVISLLFSGLADASGIPSWFVTFPDGSRVEIHVTDCTPTEGAVFMEPVKIGQETFYCGGFNVQEGKFILLSEETFKHVETEYENIHKALKLNLSLYWAKENLDKEISERQRLESLFDSYMASSEKKLSEYKDAAEEYISYLKSANAEIMDMHRSYKKAADEYIKALEARVAELTTSTGSVGITTGSPSYNSPVVYKPICAENGTCYGDISDKTGRSKTTYVKGYTKKDGTYVRGHYRSR